jgi:DinB superfamily
MMGTLSKEDIIHELEIASKEFNGFCHSISDQFFFQQRADKWSIAQNVKHLIISADRTRLVFVLPKFIVRYYVGKPNRSSRSYDELLTKYKLKLQQGGRASGRFIPKAVSKKKKKEKMLHIFSRAMNRLIVVINDKWKDSQLDQYIAPHPLLGKITLRELCYFTIFHTQHHLNNIKQRLIDYQTPDKLS